VTPYLTEVYLYRGTLCLMSSGIIPSRQTFW